MKIWLLILLTFLPPLPFIFGYFVYLIKKYQHKTYAKILSGGKWIKIDITEASGKTFSPEEYGCKELSGQDYSLETDKIATEGNIFQKKVIKYIENVPQPIWHISEYLKQLQQEEREVLREKLDEEKSELKNEEGELTEEDVKNPVNPLMFIDATELYNIRRNDFSEIFATEEEEGFSLGIKWWHIGLGIAVIVILVLLFNWSSIMSLITGSGSSAPVPPSG